MDNPKLNPLSQSQKWIKHEYKSVEKWIDFSVQSIFFFNRQQTTETKEKKLLKKIGPKRKRDRESERMSWEDE